MYNIMLVFTYFVTYVAQVEQEVQFMMYGNIFRLTRAISIFFATEMFLPIVSDTMTSNVFVIALGNLIISLLAVSAIGLLALRIGFIKKSVSVTLISAFILSDLYGNIAIGSVGNMAVSLLIAGFSLIAILAVFVTLSYKINHIEVE